MPDQNESKTPDIKADNNSIAVGGINIGGELSGSITIGNVYNYASEEDIPLTSEEIENGLTRFAQVLPERGPVLQEKFLAIAKKLRLTLGADLKSLSPTLKTQREDTVNQMQLMSMEVLDISFPALCKGQNPPPYDSRPPFRGLFAFRPEDKEFYFGREPLIQKLAERLKEYPFLAVLGPSGSGKSSLVMAGCIPALDAKMAYFTPSTVPLYQLQTAQAQADKETVFVVDQFEELFTLTRDLQERSQFIAELLSLKDKNRVIITMRADFWGEVAAYDGLKQIMQDHQELIAPMDAEELYSAMEHQAAAVGLRFDQGLSESILEDVKDEPGAMPLLQHALWTLWKRRHGLYLKTEEYQNFGGVKQAIANTAEEVYLSCSEPEREHVRDIFLRLTRWDERGEGRNTRRRALLEELTPANGDPSVTARLLNKLADARLLVKTEKEVEVAHEALIRHWKRLIGWLHEDRENLNLREDVSEAAREWEDSKRDESLLNHRGTRLELALAMSKLPRYYLNPSEQAYLDACLELRNRERRERERRQRQTLIASLSAAVIFLILAAFGLVKSNQATTQERITFASKLGAESLQLDPGKASLKLLLAIEALKASRDLPRPPVQAEQAIWAALEYMGGLPIPFDGKGSGPVAFVNNSQFVTMNAHEILIWDFQNGKLSSQKLMDLPPAADADLSSLAASPDGHWLARNSENNIDVWDLTNLQDPPVRLDFAARTIQFSADSHLLIAGDFGLGQYHVWKTGKWDSGSELAAPEEPSVQPMIASAASMDETTDRVALLKEREPTFLIPMTGGGGYSGALVPTLSRFSFESNSFATTNSSGIYVWNQDQLDKPVHTMVLDMDAFPFEALLNDRWLASVLYGEKDPVLLFWDYTRPADHPILSRFPGRQINEEVKPVIDPQRRWIAVPTEPVIQPSDSEYASGAIAILSFSEFPDPSYYYVAPHSAQVTQMVFSPTGDWLASGDANGVIYLSGFGRDGYTDETWKLRGHDGKITSLVFSPNGKFMISGDDQGQWRLWDVSSKTNHIAIWPSIIREQTGQITSSQLSSAIQSIATGLDSGTVSLWNLEDLRHKPLLLEGLNAPVSQLVLDNSGKWIVAGTANGQVARWSTNQSQPRAGIQMNVGDLFDIKISSDGHGFFTASSQGVKRWSFTDEHDSLLLSTNGSQQVQRLLSSPDSRWLAGWTGENSLLFWDLNRPDFTKKPSVDYSIPYAESYAVNDASEFLAYSDGINVYLVNLQKQYKLSMPKALVPGSSLALSAGNQYLATTSGDTITVWKRPTSSAEPIVISNSDLGDSASLLFSSDNHWLIAYGDTLVKLWNTENFYANPITLRRLRGIQELELSSDGQRMSILDNFGVVSIWELNPSKRLELACDVVGRNFTQLEWLTYFPDQAYRAACPQ